MKKHTWFLAFVLLICFSNFLKAAGGQKNPENAVSAAAVTAETADESLLYYPAHVGDTLYLNAWKKAAPDKEVFVKAEVIRTEKKADGEFYYFYGPQVDVRYLIGIDPKEGVSMRVIKYPFPFFDLSVEVTLKPKMNIIKFPLKAGEKWHYEGKGEAVILFIPFTRDLKADFEVVERVTMKTPAGDIDTYHIKVLLDQGDGKGMTNENYWYGRNIGYSAADTSGHKAELAGYRIYDDKTGQWIEKLPDDSAKYK
ncbi:MAG: hypothetical protein ABSA34_02635 [Candidatus Goldiibacteriota bacterium]